MSNLIFMQKLNKNEAIAGVALIGLLLSIIGYAQNGFSQHIDTTSNNPSVGNLIIANTSGNNSSEPEKAVVYIVPGATLLTDTAYNPNPIEIVRGQTVLWINEDSGFHTVTSGEINDPNSGILFDSGLNGPTMISSKGKTFSYKFDLPGEFKYYCILHPGMEGNVIVT
jgi:plastocyanin